MTFNIRITRILGMKSAVIFGTLIQNFNSCLEVENIYLINFLLLLPDTQLFYAAI